MTDFYGTNADYIHLKFGDMRKCYNFTEAFEAKHPNFCAEYRKYWNDSETCRFNSPLEIAQYVDMHDIPVKFYFNYTDTPVKNITEVYEYFIREYNGIDKNADGSHRRDYNHGLDGEDVVNKSYKVEAKEEE